MSTKFFFEKIFELLKSIVFFAMATLLIPLVAIILFFATLSLPFTIPTFIYFHKYSEKKRFEKFLNINK